MATVAVDLSLGAKSLPSVLDGSYEIDQHTDNSAVLPGEIKLASNNGNSFPLNLTSTGFKIRRDDVALWDRGTYTWSVIGTSKTLRSIIEPSNPVGRATFNTGKRFDWQSGSDIRGVVEIGFDIAATGGSTQIGVYKDASNYHIMGISKVGAAWKISYSSRVAGVSSVVSITIATQKIHVRIAQTSGSVSFMYRTNTTYDVESDLGWLTLGSRPTVFTGLSWGLYYASGDLSAITTNSFYDMYTRNTQTDVLGVRTSGQWTSNLITLPTDNRLMGVNLGITSSVLCKVQKVEILDSVTLQIISSYTGDMITATALRDQQLPNLVSTYSRKIFIRLTLVGDGTGNVTVNSLTYDYGVITSESADVGQTIGIDATGDVYFDGNKNMVIVFDGPKIQQDIRLIMQTQPGEDMFAKDFGFDFVSVMKTPLPSVLKTKLIEALNQWPYIKDVETIEITEWDRVTRQITVKVKMSGAVETIIVRE